MYEQKIIDELQARRMKRCAEREEGHEFYEFDDGDKVCINCQLTIEAGS